MEEYKPLEYCISGEWKHEGIIYSYKTPREVLAEIPDWSIHPDDVIVAGYPKSGNNWVVTIVSAILKAEALQTFVEEGMNGIETEPIEFLTHKKITEEVVHPRVLFTHLLPSRLPVALSTNRNKVIHLLRNPNDIAVSYYHFHRMFKPFGCFKGSWEEFFPFFIQGNIAYSSWHDHTKEWAKNAQHLNVKRLCYEDIISDPAGMVKDLASFLEISVTAKHVEMIVEIISFKKMLKYSKLNDPDPEVNQEISPFMRKGKVGDWKNYFTAEQTLQAEEKYAELVSETGLKLRFELSKRLKD